MTADGDAAPETTDDASPRPDAGDSAPADPPVIAPFVPTVPKSRLGRVRIGQWFGLGGLILGILLIASLAQSGAAIYRQSHTRELITGHIVPAALLQSQLSGAIGQQDTAIRQYAASGDRAALATYRQKIAEQARASATMRRLLSEVGGSGRSVADIAALDRAAANWRAGYAEPLAARRGSAPDTGEAPFSRIRAANASLQKDQTALYQRFARRLDDRVEEVYWSLALAVLITVLSAAGLTWLIRRGVLRPLSSLATNVRAVAQGDLTHSLELRGSAEFVELAAIVDGMRQRLIDEWRFTSEARRRLDEQATELRRSNAELEQFAYVASHDLQEPLRKVASFCRMLERKYGDKLDDRGKQYVDFAVDGAKRMQVLINDLLSFSRVGRIERREATIDLRVCLERALFSLAQLREETEAEVTADELPRLPGDQTQYTQLLQNLIGNAIKFHGDEPPRVHIGARRDGAFWEFSCSDNGIGIDAKYGERIFLIFQRLHPQDVYTGTGIGLAMCKKIVEHHGGRIWLDTSASASDDPNDSGTTAGGGTGTTIRWTLPAGENDG
ncbi:sensor histidine kinase [Actinoallomurus iriomotensis]|uniref:histidine kinase n=1 Tax=Actinoallomurus iriomotensis TaxID=478107 RepID=A0A9W6RNU6_9ACTN|nr:ATP-binding protein [Actinoallomurus iriomotensis]GLY79144.1 histidine kinase [Actinoallomurus iriomotensis]